MTLLISLLEIFLKAGAQKMQTVPKIGLSFIEIITGQ
jgi:hypothetical protein